MSQIKFDPDDGVVHLEMERSGFHNDVLDLFKELLPVVSHGRGGGRSTTRGKSSGFGSMTGPYVSRMKDRRRREDDRDRRGRRGNGGGRGNGDDFDKLLFIRPDCMMAYAIDVTTLAVYVGYSGGGSAVFSNKLRGYGNRKYVRQQRVRPFLRNVTQRTGFDPLNCAEVAALSVALSHGANIGNLYFISMDSNGHLRNPCGNCIQWITQHARGYHEV